MFKTKLEAVNELVKYDHAFLTPIAVAEFCKPFGFDPKKFMYKVPDRRSEFKGLYVPEGKEGDVYEGADASELAADFCNTLKIEYREMFGRGSRLRECCRALREALQ